MPALTLRSKLGLTLVLAVALLLLPARSTPVLQPLSKPVAANGSWTMYHHDNGHTGYDATVPPLSSVSTGWVSPAMDGEVYASPLINNGVVYAATLHNTVYAFNQSDGVALWSKNVGAPQTGGWGCGNINPTGILGTPVIDVAANRIYVVAEITGTTPTYHLFGLDLANSGNIVLDTPIAPAGFDWTIEQERGALALANGYVYVPFGGRIGDCGVYHGYVVGVPVSGSTSLAVYQTPGSGNGFWAAGGVVVDNATGNVFETSGNGNVGNGCNTVAGGAPQFENDAVVRLSPTLAHLDSFMPSDWQNNWCKNDQDLGSASPVLISPNLMFQSGKWGGGFLLNPNSLGGVDGQLFPTPKPAAYAQAEACFGNHNDATFGSFAYAAPYVYAECEGKGLAAINVNTGTNTFNPCDATCASPNWNAGAGATFGPPIVAGGAVWAADNSGLYAFNTATGAQVFHSASFGINRFVSPSEAGGQVFVPSHTVIRSFQMNFAFSLQSLGGVLTSGPAGSSWGATRADAFVGGTDISLWQTTSTGSTWNGWTRLGGTLTSDPTAASLGTNRIDVFVRGTDRGLWHIWWDGVQWNGWEPLGGALTSAPAASTQGANWIDVEMRGTDNALWHRWWDSAGWHAWEPLGGILTADPASVSWAPGRLDIVARGTDNGLWIRSWSSTTGWSNWQSLGGYLTSAPSVSSCASGQLDVWALGTDTGLWRLSFAAGAWGTWQSFGGQWTSRPSATCRPGTTSTDVYIRGVDKSLWHLGF